jgi:hypothetical protein
VENVTPRGCVLRLQACDRQCKNGGHVADEARLVPEFEIVGFEPHGRQLQRAVAQQRHHLGCFFDSDLHLIGRVVRSRPDGREVNACRCLRFR